MRTFVETAFRSGRTLAALRVHPRRQSQVYPPAKGDIFRRRVHTPLGKGPERERERERDTAHTGTRAQSRGVEGGSSSPGHVTIEGAHDDSLVTDGYPALK